MIGAIGRNAPCPCGSGKKYKNCCLGKSQPEKSDRASSPLFRFDPGSYGGAGAFTPSIACLKQMQPNKWEYHFVLVKPTQAYHHEEKAALEAGRDLDAAFRDRQRTGSDFTVAESLRAKGYVSVNDFRIVAEETGRKGSIDDAGFRQI